MYTPTPILGPAVFLVYVPRPYVFVHLCCWLRWQVNLSVRLLSHAYVLKIMQIMNHISQSYLHILHNIYSFICLRFYWFLCPNCIKYQAMWKLFQRRAVLHFLLWTFMRLCKSLKTFQKDWKGTGELFPIAFLLIFTASAILWGHFKLWSTFFLVLSKWLSLDHIFILLFW